MVRREIPEQLVVLRVVAAVALQPQAQKLLRDADIDTVSGATISSKAYKKGIGIAFDAFKAIREAEHENAE